MRENQEKAQDKRAELDAIIAKRAEEAKEIKKTEKLEEQIEILIMKNNDKKSNCGSRNYFDYN